MLLRFSILFILVGIGCAIPYFMLKRLKGRTTGVITGVTKYQSEFNIIGSKIEGLTYDINTGKFSIGKRATNGTDYLV